MKARTWVPLLLAAVLGSAVGLPVAAHQWAAGSRERDLLHAAQELSTADLQGAWAATQQRFTSPTPAGDFLALASKTANNHGLTVAAFTSNPAPAPAPLSATTWSLTLTASGAPGGSCQGAIAGFASDLQASKRAVVVTRAQAGPTCLVQATVYTVS